MDSKQEAKLNMYDAVLSHCDANNAIVATVPAFQTAVGSFEDVIDDLRDAAQNEIQAIGGVAIDKAEQKKQLIETTLDISGAIFAFASATDNFILKEQVNFSHTDLNRLKDELLAPACQNVLAAANSNAAALIAYGVTAAKITALDDAIDDYTSAVPAPRNAVSNRSSIGDSIKQLLKDGDEILKDQMDKLVIQFKSTQTNFYNAYKSNRVILDPASSATKLEGVARDQATSNPLSGVSIQVVDQPYSTLTDGLGQYSLTIPVPGSYNVQFSKSSYQSQTINNVEITLGQSSSLDVALVSMPTS